MPFSRHTPTPAIPPNDVDVRMNSLRPDTELCRGRARPHLSRWRWRGGGPTSDSSTSVRGAVFLIWWARFFYSLRQRRPPFRPRRRFQSYECLTRGGHFFASLMRRQIHVVAAMQTERRARGRRADRSMYVPDRIIKGQTITALPV